MSIYTYFEGKCASNSCSKTTKKLRQTFWQPPQENLRFAFVICHITLEIGLFSQFFKIREINCECSFFISERNAVCSRILARNRACLQARNIRAIACTAERNCETAIVSFHCLFECYDASSTSHICDSVFKSQNEPNFHRKFRPAVVELWHNAAAFVCVTRIVSSRRFWAVCVAK